MTEFISSLVIQPVFRQARRFSRHMSDPSPILTTDSEQDALSVTTTVDTCSLTPQSNESPAAGFYEHSEQDLRKEDSQPTNSSFLPMTSFEFSYLDGARTLFRNRGTHISATGALLDDGTRFKTSHDPESHTDFNSIPENSRRHAADVSHVDPIQGSRIAMPGTGFVMQPSDWDEKGQQLPEDDGMRILREKIHAIRDREISNAEKARMMHNLMTESYKLSQNLSRPSSIMADSPSSPENRERPLTPTSHQSRIYSDLSFPPTSTVSVLSFTNEYNLSPKDLIPTFVPKNNILTRGFGFRTLLSEDIENDDSLVEDRAILGCQHYQRNVKLQCYTCKKWYTCRFCHDEVEDHSLVRQKTENMLCMLCGQAQSASQWCKGCGERAASYYCDLCKLWDNDDGKSIYHCHDCGICRLGKGLGKDFFHCKTCSVCMPISIENTHRCIERSTQCDCPICGEYMFTSPEMVVFMRCGHPIHHKCHAEYSKISYRCPICSKSIINMEARFRNLDHTIESQPMPPEFRDTKAFVYCNDCGAKSAVQYHWLGLKCELCESYNTLQIRLFRGSNVENPGNDNRQDRRFSAPRPRSYSIDEIICPHNSETPPLVMSGSVPGTNPHLSQDDVFQSRARTVSPIIRNYFGLSRERDAAETSSNLSAKLSSDNKHDTKDDLGFWGATSLQYRYRLFGNDIEATNDESEPSDGDDESLGNTEDEDEDDIDIFGHL